MSGGSKSKNKGNSGERMLCSILEKVFGLKFLRSNSSGAFLGQSNVWRKKELDASQISNLKSDIVCPEKLRHLVFECKNYANFSFHQLYDENKQLDEWIKQVLVGLDPGDVWIVCMKFNRLGWWICIPYNESYILKSHTIYYSKFGKVVISQLLPFLEDNKNVLEIKPKVLNDDL